MGAVSFKNLSSPHPITVPDRDTPAGHGSEYAEHLSAVLDQAAHYRTVGAAKKEPRPSGPRGGLLIILFLGLMGVVGYNVTAFRSAPLPVSEARARTSDRLTTLAATAAVRSFRAEHGRWPATLEEAGMPGSELVYRVTGDTFQLARPEPAPGIPPQPVDPLAELERLGVEVPLAP